MIRSGKRGRFEALHSMASCTFPAARSLKELTVVIVFVTIYTCCEWERRLEVPVRVAIGTIHGLVLAEQGVFGLRVVESLKQCDPFPVRGVMAGLARRGEAALMRIGVTSRTLREGEPRVLNERLRVLHCGMAFRAENFFVRPGQGKFRLRMVEH